MSRIRFTHNLARFIDTDEIVATGHTVAEVMAAACEQRPKLREWVLDDQGSLRHHMSLFIDGVQIRDRVTLSDSIADDSVIDIIQALSGG